MDVIAGAGVRLHGDGGILVGAHFHLEGVFRIGKEGVVWGIDKKLAVP